MPHHLQAECTFTNYAQMILFQLKKCYCSNKNNLTLSPSPYQGEGNRERLIKYNLLFYAKQQTVSPEFEIKPPSPKLAERL